MSRIAIIGGDDRVRGDDWGDGFRAYTGDDSGRLVKAAKDGSITGVIALSKFMHGQLKNGLRSLPKEVKVVFYPGSLNSLRDALPTIVAENFTPPAPPPETIKQPRSFRPTIGEAVAAKLNGVHAQPAPPVPPRPFTETEDRRLRSIINTKGTDGLVERFERATGNRREQHELEERYINMPLLHQIYPMLGKAMVNMAKTLSDGLPHSPADAYGQPAASLGVIAPTVALVFGDSVGAVGEKAHRRYQVVHWETFRQKCAAIGVEVGETNPDADGPIKREPAKEEPPVPLRVEPVEQPPAAAPSVDEDLRAAVATLTEAVATIVEAVAAANSKLDTIAGWIVALKLRGGM